MAKATRKRELATEQQEQGDDNTPATGNSPADRLQQRLEYMQWVNDLIRQTLLRRDIEHEEKKARIIDQLRERGSDDDEIRYILTKKPARDGNEYYGFTFREVADVKDQIGTEALLAKPKKGFVEREEERRANRPDGQGNGIG